MPKRQIIHRELWKRENEIKEKKKRIESFRITAATDHRFDIVSSPVLQSSALKLADDEVAIRFFSTFVSHDVRFLATALFCSLNVSVDNHNIALKM